MFCKREMPRTGFTKGRALRISSSATRALPLPWYALTWFLACPHLPGVLWISGLCCCCLHGCAYSNRVPDRASDYTATQGSGITWSYEKSQKLAYITAFMVVHFATMHAFFPEYDVFGGNIMSPA